jgi:DHA1 family inner membrane transport protein
VVSQARLLDLLALGNFVVGMGAFVVVGIISPMASGLHVSKSDAGIVLTAYAIAYAVLSPVGAAATGKLRRRTVLVAALLLFCAGSIVSATATSLPIMTASRVLVAFGAALYTPLSAGMAAALTLPEQRGRALARVFGGITLAQVAGVPVGAWLAYRFGWPVAFWTVGALAGLVAAVLLAAIPRDVSFPATTVRTVLQTLSNGPLMFAISFTGTIMTAIYVIFTYFGPLIEASAGTNPEARTVYLLLFGFGAVAGNFLGGVLSDRIGPYKTLLIVCAAQVLLLPLFAIQPWNLLAFGLLVAVWSTCGWLYMAAQQSRLVSIMPEAPTLALALNAAMIYVGIAIGSVIAAAILGRFGLAGLGLGGGVIALLALLHLILSHKKVT